MGALQVMGTYVEQIAGDIGVEQPVNRGHLASEQPSSLRQYHGPNADPEHIYAQR